MSKKTEPDATPSPVETSPEQPVSPSGDGQGDVKGDVKKIKGKRDLNPRRALNPVHSTGAKSFANTLAARSERSLADMYRIQDGVPEHVIEWSVSTAPFPRCWPPDARELREKCATPLSLHFCIFSLPSARYLLPIPLLPCLSISLTLQLKCFGHFDAAANSFSKEMIRDPLLDELDLWEIRESLFLGGRHEVTGEIVLAPRVR